MKTYQSLIQRLFNVNLFGGVKLGLQNMQHLQQFFHYPDRSFHSIHVAGTNGKGSVSIKMATALEQEGYKVGLFTSPHLACFRERIRFNGKMISEQDVQHLLPSIFHLVDTENLPATFFEITTMLAFLYFSQEKVDFAVFETGLGGRLDATNVILPCLSIITSISLDHTEILGMTRDAIALEKAGIIKENVPVVIGPHVPLMPIQSIADKKKSSIFQVKSKTPLFEEENCEIAQTALNLLSESFFISSQSIKKGLKAKQPCRFEVLESSPIIILDVAHNPNGLQYLFQMIQHHYPHHRLRVLFGLSKSKDLSGCLKLLATHGTHFHIVEATNGRGASRQELYEALKNEGISTTCLFLHEDIEQGVHQAKQAAESYQEILVICGSFFIMADVRRALGYQEPHDFMDMNERRLA